MSRLSRRGFLETAAGGLAAWRVTGRRAEAYPAAAPKEAKVPLVHFTDLFRPHADPDDHFDLASAYALAFQGRLELRAVVIDHPPADFERDPDVLAVAQMNRITGLSVPVLTGSARRPGAAEAAGAGKGEAASATALLEILRGSDRPVAVTVVGSARDVALAGRTEPELFAAKCAGIYLNSGSGTRDRAKAAHLEYNVGLDPASYAAVFDIPCPLYWMPCFEVAPGSGQPFAGGEYGTYYHFLQKDVLPSLSTCVQNYFAFMFKQGESDREDQSEAEALRPNWLRYLEGPREEALLERQGKVVRNMWSTAGFLHAAGLAVTPDGELAPLDRITFPLYTFDPVRVRCGPDGVTEWTPDPGSKKRFLFHVRDSERYAGAMTAGLKSLLGALP
jgi:hypothetical protein